ARVLAASAVGALLAACGRPAPPATPTRPAQLETVEIPFCAIPWCLLPFEVARQRGLFAQEGLDVALQFMGPVLAAEALAGGRADFSATPMVNTLAAAAGQGATVTIARTFVRPFLWLISSPRATGVNSVADLAGKRVST